MESTLGNELDPYMDKKSKICLSLVTPALETRRISALCQQKILLFQVCFMFHCLDALCT